MNPKTVIVTGGSQGIGAGLVKSFLDRDYNVVANSRNMTKSDAFQASKKLALGGGWAVMRSLAMSMQKMGYV